jgi:glycerol-3-phosphate dehydrogenase (NAD(P)+)
VSATGARRRVVIIGAGAWGTALGVHLAARAHAASDVVLVARDAGVARVLAEARENCRYLPGVPLPPALELSATPAVAKEADLIIVATPVAALCAVADELRAIGCSAPLVWLSKGFVSGADGAAMLAHQVLAPRWPAPVGTVSGPTFAEEVARGLPAAVAVASTDNALTGVLAQMLRGDALRAYESADLPGVEVGGALKNVLAIAAGASDALGFGQNARAALITRGLAETGRLSSAMGGQRETLMGLAGLGDLVLTCTGDLSRNRRVGIALAEGRSLTDTLATLGHVAEGVFAAVAARDLAQRHRVDMPISDAVWRVLHAGVPVRDAVVELLRREPRREDAR